LNAASGDAIRNAAAAEPWTLHVVGAHLGACRVDAEGRRRIAGRVIDTVFGDAFVAAADQALCTNVVRRDSLGCALLLVAAAQIRVRLRTRRNRENDDDENQPTHDDLQVQTLKKNARAGTHAHERDFTD
jgi:hypothetical protein